MTDLLLKVLSENLYHARFSFYRQSQFLHILLYTVFVCGVAKKLLYTSDRLKTFSNEFLAELASDNEQKKVKEFCKLLSGN